MANLAGLKFSSSTGAEEPEHEEPEYLFATAEVL